MPRRAASSAIAASAASSISAPVGLPGELMMMPRVRGVIAARNVSARSRKPSSGVGADDHRRRLGELDLLDERRPARHVRDDLVARAEERHHGVEQRLLAAGRDDDFGGRVVDAVVLLVAARDRALEILGAGVGRVLREVGVDRGLARRRRRAPASESPARRPRSRARRSPAPSASWRRPPPSSSGTRRYVRHALQASNQALTECCAALLSRSRASTTSGTRPCTVPPSATTSLTSRELT